MTNFALSNTLLVVMAVGMTAVIILWVIILTYAAKMMRDLHELVGEVRQALGFLKIFKPKKRRDGTEKSA